MATRAATGHTAPALAEVAASSAPGASEGAALVAFFALAFALSWAAWLPTALASRGLPGWDLPPELSRPVGAFGPTLAALLVTAVCSGPRGVRALLARLAIWRVGLGWYAFALVGHLSWVLPFG